jgi:hypothetical protein
MSAPRRAPSALAVSGDGEKAAVLPQHPCSQGPVAVVQLTPPGSAASIIFGQGTTAMAPGSLQDLTLVVAAGDALIGHGVDVSDVWHDETCVFHHGGTEGRVPGPDPEGRSYGSWASFMDPDGNGWLLQEIKQRLPGRV